MAALGVGAVLAAATVGARVTSSSNRALARADATALLSAVRLPVGAVRSSGEPAGDRGVLRTPSLVQSGNVVDRHAWWVVALKPAALDAFVRRHRPAGSELSFSGSQGRPGSGVSQLDEAFSWPAQRGRLRTRWQLVAIAPLPRGRSGVRVDGQDVWITPRLASQRIPTGSARLTVVLRRAGRVVAGPYTFAARRRIGRVRALINSLPSSQPGVQSCPEDGGYDVRLTFISSGGAMLAVVDADPQGCEGVGLTVRGRAQHPLTSEAFPGSGRSVRRALIGQLDGALGLKLAGRLSFGPAVHGRPVTAVSQPSR